MTGIRGFAAGPDDALRLVAPSGKVRGMRNGGDKTTAERDCYPWDERHLFEPPPCPACGSRDIHVMWSPSGCEEPDTWAPVAFDCPHSHGRM